MSFISTTLSEAWNTASKILNTEVQFYGKDPNEKPKVYTVKQFAGAFLGGAAVGLALSIILFEPLRRDASKLAASLDTKYGLCLSQTCQDASAFDAAFQTKNLTAVFDLIGNDQFVKPNGWVEKVTKLILESPENKQIENTHQFFQLTMKDDSKELCEHQHNLYFTLLNSQNPNEIHWKGKKYKHPDPIVTMHSPLFKMDECSLIKYAFCVNQNFTKELPSLKIDPEDISKLVGI